jgi:hypothetical protein
MTGYADPELMISAWLGSRLGGVKVWADPMLPANWSFTAPIGHVQRGAGEGDTALTLDAVLLDVDWYAATADHARTMAEKCRTELRLNLPLHTFPNGVLVKAVDTLMAPCWGPDPTVFRRMASYRVILSGMVS